MSKSLHRLTASRAKALSKPGRHTDGGGLQLRIRTSGSKSWVFNYLDGGRRRDLGLGGFDSLSLAEARAKAAICRAAIAKGQSPRSAFKKPNAVTFSEAAHAYINMRRSDWRSAKTIYKWEMFLQRYGKDIGRLPCDDIKREDVEAALRPHWTRINHWPAPLEVVHFES